MNGLMVRLRGNRTMGVAMAATVVLAVGVALGWIPASRALPPLILVWGLAMNSQEIVDHKVELLAQAERLARAGMEARAGQIGACVDDLTAVGQAATQVVLTVRAEHERSAAGSNG